MAATPARSPLSPGPTGVLFKVEGKGWPEGWHGVHLHAVGTCEGPGFTSAGAHVNHADPDKRRTAC